MTARTLLLVVTLLVSAAAAGASTPAVGGASASPAHAEGTAAAPAGPTEPPDPTGTNGTENASDAEGSEDDRRFVADFPAGVTKGATLDPGAFPAAGGSAARTLEVRTANATPGAVRSFPTLDQRTGEYVFKNFTLRRVDEHGEIWVANDMAWPATPGPRGAVSNRHRLGGEDAVLPNAGAVAEAGRRGRARNRPERATVR